MLRSELLGNSWIRLLDKIVFKNVFVKKGLEVTMFSMVSRYIDELGFIQCKINT